MCVCLLWGLTSGNTNKLPLTMCVHVLLLSVMGPEFQC